MNYIIYGINRVAKDFLYMFENLNILYLTDDIVETNTIWGRHVENLEAALCDASYDQIILCDFDKSRKEEILQKRGLRYNLDYVYEEDFFEQLDEISIPSDRRVLVWGTGKMCHLLLEQELPFSVKAFIDSYKKQDRFMEKPLFYPQEIEDWKKYYITVAVNRAEEIFKALSKHGLKEKEDFISYLQIIYLPSELKEVLADPVMKSEIVDLGTIQYTHKEDAVDIVENYCMWELEKRGGKLFC